MSQSTLHFLNCNSQYQTSGREYCRIASPKTQSLNCDDSTQTCKEDSKQPAHLQGTSGSYSAETMNSQKKAVSRNSKGASEAKMIKPMDRLKDDAISPLALDDAAMRLDTTGCEQVNGVGRLNTRKRKGETMSFRCMLQPRARLQHIHAIQAAGSTERITGMVKIRGYSV